MVIDAGYAYTATSAYERPQGFGFYAIKPDGRAGNYFVNAHKQSRRDQIRANVLASSFEAAGLHRIKAGADIDVVHYSQDVQRTGYENYDRYGRLLNRTTFGGPTCAINSQLPRIHLRRGRMGGTVRHDNRVRCPPGLGRTGTAYCSLPTFFGGSLSIREHAHPSRRRICSCPRRIEC